MTELDQVTLLAEQARQLRDQANQAQDDYLRAVRAARDAGHSMTLIAHVSGISRTALYKSLAKRDKPVPIDI